MKKALIILFYAAVLGMFYSLIGMVWIWEYSGEIFTTSLIVFVFSLFIYWGLYYNTKKN